MATIVFSLTDPQVRMLAALKRGDTIWSSDPRIVTALRQKQLIEPNDGQDEYRATSWALTPAGEAAIALCERLASLRPLLKPK